MIVYLLAFLILVLVVVGMAVGVIFSNKPIKGSCGGLGAIGITTSNCEICGGDTQKCDDEQERVAKSEGKETPTQKKALAYDATKNQ
ncbi:(Na+)-NQR maturation NqrM [Teredinibacter purpureus]|uniref:(Na+)-NQR maturation NqrM n=1 Tax=Teredinibacter purpureus TaxID=2731756 RepID=UPI0005F83967|nr:(Na+)-NQR maturation NqrM [Teredinibacter purpureus]